MIEIAQQEVKMGYTTRRQWLAEARVTTREAPFVLKLDDLHWIVVAHGTAEESAQSRKRRRGEKKYATAILIPDRQTGSATFSSQAKAQQAADDWMKT